MIMTLTGRDSLTWTANQTVTNPDDLVGWVPQNAGRGTLDIIWSCFFTILICTWTTIHPRIHTSARLARWHKALVLFKMLLAPDLVCLESLQEWIQARKLVRRVDKAIGMQLDLSQSFYIGMMGVRYRTQSGWNVLWPNQYAWLLRQKLVDWNNCLSSWGLDKRTIRDKSKADGLIKLAALWQVAWFTIQCITHEANQVPISPLEAMTLAYVAIAFITYGFWWKKPKDIATASFIELPHMTELQRATFDSLAMEPTYDTDEYGIKPSKNIAWYLVARDCDDDRIARLLEDGTSDGVFELCDVPVRKRTTTTEEKEVFEIRRAIPLPTLKPKQGASTADSSIITEWDSTLYMTKWWPGICLLGALFGALHLISWNSRFPTTVELWLWRGSALASIATSILSMQFRTVSLAWEGPLTILRLGSPILYVISRIIMTGQVFAALRAMPAKTYGTSVIWSYWFHFS